MKNRSTKITFPVFGYQVRVIFSADVQKTCRRLRENPGECEACFICREDLPHGYIVFHLAPDEGTIAHEASHAVQEMFRRAGAKRDEEVFAYHLGFLVERIHKFIRKKPKPKGEIEASPSHPWAQ